VTAPEGKQANIAEDEELSYQVLAAARAEGVSGWPLQAVEPAQLTCRQAVLGSDLVELARLQAL
jgi:hypothetical protein